MAVVILLQRINGRLVPETSADAETMDEMASGVTYRATMTRATGRSVKHHRLLFAILGIARDNYDGVITLETVLQVVKIRTGCVDAVGLPSGEVILVPKSISFAKMGQDEFNRFFDKAVTVLCRDFVPGLAEDMARREVERRVNTGPEYRMAA